MPESKYSKNMYLMQKEILKNNFKNYEKSILLVLGAGIMQVPVIVEAQHMGLYVIAADANVQAYGAKHADEFWHYDIKNIQSIIDRFEQEGRHPSGVITCATDFSYNVACIAEHFCLVGIGRETAEIANYKDRMRNILSQAGVRIPLYHICSFLETGYSPVEALKYCDEIYKKFAKIERIVIKPVDNMGARGVIEVGLNSSSKELQDALEYALSFSHKQTIIVEQCLSGPELSIDSFLQNGRLYPMGIADRHIHCSPYFIETGHSIPSMLSFDMQKAACTLLEKAAKAAGFENGICKGDIIFDEKTPYIGEFAARLSGGYMSGWTIGYSNFQYQGYTPTKIAIAQAMGQKIQILGEEYAQVKKEEGLYCEEKALFSLEGEIKDILVDSSIYKHEGFRNLIINAKKGETHSFPQSNVEKIGSLIVTGKTKSSANKWAVQALSRIIFKVERSVEMNHFLFSPTEQRKEKYSVWNNYDEGLVSMLEKELKTSTTTIQEFELIKTIHTLSEDANLGDFIHKAPLSLYIPQILHAHKEIGAWSHCNIDEMIEVLVHQGIVREVDQKEDSIGLFFWRALIRGAWQGLHYLLEINISDLKELARGYLE